MVFLTGAEVLSRSTGSWSTLFLQLSDSYRDSSLRDVQYAHQHLHPRPEGEVSLFILRSIQRGAKYKPNARACGGIPAASQLWPTQWRQWEIANKNRVYCPVYWSCCINISLQFPNDFSHTSASMKDIQLSITFLLAILSITIHHWVNLFPFLLWAIGWKLHTHKRLMWKNDEIRAYCSWLTDSFT